MRILHTIRGHNPARAEHEKSKQGDEYDTKHERRPPYPGVAIDVLSRTTKIIWSTLIRHVRSPVRTSSETGDAVVGFQQHLFERSLDWRTPLASLPSRSSEQHRRDSEERDQRGKHRQDAPIAAHLANFAIVGIHDARVGCCCPNAARASQFRKRVSGQAAYIMPAMMALTPIATDVRRDAKRSQKELLIPSSSLLMGDLPTYAQGLCACAPLRNVLSRKGFRMFPCSL